MSVTSTSAAVSHTGNGVADTFAFTFKVFDETDLYINTYEIATGTLTLLALTTDYTVSLTNGGQDGGEVTLVAGPLAATHKIIIQRLLSYTQETDYVENDAFPAESTEDALDKLTMLIQQLKEELDRALLGSITTEAGVIAIGYDSGLPTIAVADADKLVQVNAGGTAYELTTVAGAITATINAAIAINTLTEKTDCVDADLIVIEDSADANARKKVQLGNLSIGGDVEVFDTTNTWTKPSGCSVVKVVCIGGGGGGGGGISRIAVNQAGGTGGGGGARAEMFFRAADLTNTVTVTVGAGGTGASVGVSPTPGGNSSFGAYLLAYGGGAGITGGNNVPASGGGGGGTGGVGQAGQASADSTGGLPAVTAGVAGQGGAGGGGDVDTPCTGKSAEYGGGGGGGCLTGTNAGAVGGYSIYGGGGGGAGGGTNTTTGAAGGNGGATPKGSGGAGGAAGNPGVSGGDGTDGDVSRCGTGGGGGGALNAVSGKGGHGGKGGKYGGGGGGGGSHEQGAAGNIGDAYGGDGGQGIVIVYTW